MSGSWPVVLNRWLRIWTLISRRRFCRTIVRCRTILIWTIRVRPIWFGPICFGTIRLLPILIRAIRLGPLWLRRFGTIAGWGSLRPLVSRRLVGWTITHRRPIVGRVWTRVRGLIVRRLIVGRLIARTILWSIRARLIAATVLSRTRTFVSRWIVRSGIVGPRIIYPGTVSPRIVGAVSMPTCRACDGLGYGGCGLAYGSLPDLRPRYLLIRGSCLFHLPHLLPGNRLSRIRRQRFLPHRKRNWSWGRSRPGNDRATSNCRRRGFDFVCRFEARA